MKKLRPEDLKNPEQFELLAEVEHRQIKKFIFEQITPGVRLIRIYSIYQMIMLVLLGFLAGHAVIRLVKGIPEPLIHTGYAVLFSFTVLIFLHELLHAFAYWVCGARKLKAGMMLKKFIFYVMADKEVIELRTFRIVAFAPLVTVKLVCLIAGVLSWYTPYAYFFFSVMCIHSLFCAGDMAMLAFYSNHSDKEIYNYDDMEQGKTFFYYRNKKGLI
ncbi:MAG: DUF3267 domain-containing protein [Prolixibacteraceae bacterium]